MRTIEEIRSERQRLHDEQKAIVRESTEARLERNRLAIQSLAKEESQFWIAAKRKTPEPCEIEKAATQRILDNMQTERLAIQEAGGLLASRFIRPDAVEHFEAELRSRREAINEKIAAITGPTSRPGPRLMKEDQDSYQAILDWKQKFRKIAEVGERVYKIRKDREGLQSRRDALQHQRQQAGQAIAAGAQ